MSIFRVKRSTVEIAPQTIEHVNRYYLFGKVIYTSRYVVHKFF